MNPAQLNARLEALRGKAPPQSPNVRVLAAFASHTGCGLASAGFAARVDFDRLLQGTRFAAPFGQSPFAFARGNSFENLLRKDGHSELRRLLGEIGFAASEGNTANLRKGFARSEAGQDARAKETRRLVRGMLEGRSDAANLIDGAVFQADIAGMRANFEADAVAARFGGQLRAGEAKSFPVVDGQADKDKLGAALEQVAFYLLLLRREVDALGAPPEKVSPEALIITPRNVGLTPMISVENVSRRIDRAERLLAKIPNAADAVDAINGDAGFGVVGDTKEEEARRVDALQELTAQVGNDYSPDCLSSCGNAFFCRERAQRDSSPRLLGAPAVRLLPCVDSLSRADALASGQRPSAEERPVSLQLVRAARLYDGAAPLPMVTLGRRRAR